jgi:hypothetical protein
VGVRLSSRLRYVLEPGVRLTYVPERHSVYAEPRIAIRYDSPEGTYAARIATGLYRQFVNQFDLTSVGATALVPSTLFWLPLDGSLAPPRAYHAAAELLWKPGPTWSISAELYHKWQSRLLVLDYVALTSDHGGSLAQSEFISPTSGRVYGAGLGISRAGRRLEPELRYTFSHATRRFPGRFSENDQPAPWNTPHKLEVDLRAAVTEHLHLNTGWLGAWGRSWGYRRAYYDYEVHQAESGFERERPDDHLLPPIYQLDIGATYGLSLENMRAEVRAFVSNVLDRPNVYDWSLGLQDSSQRVARTLPGRNLFLSVTLGY